MTTMTCVCCPIDQDPCDGLVVGIFPAIVLVVIGGIFTRTILKFLPETRTLVPNWAQFVIGILVQLGVGYMIQYMGCIRNMWKTPSNNAILASLFFMIFAPLLLPVVLRAL